MAAPVESVTKTIFNITELLRLNLKVTLATRDMSQRRKRFLYTREYTSNWYRDTGKLSALYVGTQDYLIIESDMPYEKRADLPDWKAKRVIFSYDTIHMLEQLFATAYDWLINPEHNLFTTKDGNEIFAIAANIIPIIQCESKHLKGMSECVVSIKPTIIQIPGEEHKKRAVMVLFGTNPAIEISPLTISELASVLYFLQHFDLCTASMTIVNQSLLALPFISPAKKEPPVKSV